METADPPMIHPCSDPGAGEGAVPCEVLVNDSSTEALMSALVSAPRGPVTPAVATAGAIRVPLGGRPARLPRGERG
ncbi:hypothetical protein SLNWT_1435 [Streptomyces albus]|uniref:Uncharacterized protein n=1 Tax=Streptomyces albus (strain ATCC 21838 / DSM 41398 / FERM P-419 / JCM 4703 / NBRC 107858) TaxID=1081613 RepID=A0A0B5ESU5_STRA4|nr:hypothetical protein SLNWT_1435 [Streptomyces albus]AOU76127.1 hypothetical protein SLNHY_1436 [Streptomyces albus]AYN31919.1 hypothetical protein DUI70_1415 [Streptomyces albus]